jgi:hypothetical protein
MHGQHGMQKRPQILLCAAVVLTVVAMAVAQDHGPAVGSFTLAPVRSALGAYRNDSLNSWGGAMVHTPEDTLWP